MASKDQNNLRELVRHLLSLRNSSRMERFLDAILTPKELEEIPRRLQIVKLLKRGVPQREIADRLGVGIATVTKGSRELHQGKFEDIK